MMAPVCLAGRLLLSGLLTWLFVFPQNYCTLLTYDRQALLDIRKAVVVSSPNFLPSDLVYPFYNFQEPFQSAPPRDIRHWPLNISRRKQRRKRGNRAGLHRKAGPRAGLHRAGIHFRQCRGVAHGLLRPLRKVSSSPTITTPPKLALINARSLVNKTFLLHLFFFIPQLGFYVHHGSLDEGR